jgi:hypothetical protein
MKQPDPAQPVPPHHRHRAAYFHALLPLFFSLLIGWACYAVSGVSLGLFFGPILLITFVAPGLALSENERIPRLLTCVALTLGIAVVWLLVGDLSAALVGDLSAANALRCCGVLAAYIFALAGFAAILVRFKIDSVYAVTITVAIGFAWLTWPVWLSPWLYGSHAEQIAHWLATAHPLMAINAVLFERFNFWDRYTMSYQQLTTLNQDVFYTLPKGVAAMIVLHAGVGSIGWWCSPSTSSPSPK